MRHGGKNAERVHQLRVATRRAAAALDLYHDFVPRKSAKKMEARLKRIRRTAGDIRDCDMLLARFSSEVAQANRRVSQTNPILNASRPIAICADFIRTIPRPAV